VRYDLYIYVIRRLKVNGRDIQSAVVNTAMDIRVQFCGGGGNFQTV
jgi:hypothetical protein